MPLIRLPGPGPRQPGRWRRCLRATALGVLVLLAAFYAVENGRGAYAWSRAKARLAAAGESLDLKKFEPPRFPADENFCATPALDGVGGDDDPTNAAQKRLTDLDFDRHRRKSRAYVSQPRLTRDPPDWKEWRTYLEASTVLDIPQEEPNSAKAIALSFAPHEALFEELIQAARDRPHARFDPPLFHADMDNRLLRTACALERYFLSFQKYPDSLDALRPDYLPEIPSDLDSQSLRYALDETNGRYRLWSVGENLVDDWRGQPPPEPVTKAGRRPPSPEHAIDWVLWFPPPSP